MTRSYLPAIEGYIQRPRIDALIRDGLNYALVLVVAGPGFGKTLSVAHFMRSADVRLVWVRISGSRTKGVDFWDDMAQAVGKELPGDAAKLEELGFPDSPGKFKRFRETAVKTAETGKRLVLVIDNYERILDEGITQFLNNLADSDLPNFTMFILCNVMLPFAEALPAAGQFRISDRDLAFDAAETEMMLRHYNIEPVPGLVDRIQKVTDGWPLGLRLVCQSDPRSPEAHSSRTPLQMANDLYEQHYFQKYPADVQTQLVLFSLLPQFSLDMLDHEMETPRDVFGSLLMMHPFVSYDYLTGQFMLQRMYHDFLRQKLTLISPESRRDTMTRAGRWFLDHAMTHEAMDCFWEAGEYGDFLKTIASLPRVRKPVSITNRILSRLEQVPRSYADKNPVVDYNIAFMCLNAADMHRARKMFLEVEMRLRDEEDSEEKRLLLGDLYATLADISTYLNEDSGLAWMKKACELIPGGSRTHSPELMAIGNSSAFFLPGNQPGELERMVEYFFEYAQYADVVKNGCGYGYEYLFAGEAAYHKEEMDRAATMLNSAILKAQRTGQHDIICNALWGLGRIELYYGNHKNALALLREIELYINENALVGLYELRDCATAFFYIRLDDLDKVPAWFSEPMFGAEETPVVMARKHLTTAQFLSMKGDMARAYAVILQMESLLEPGGMWYERLRLYILKAQHHMGAKSPKEFEEAFAQAYNMVHGNDLKLLLSGYGKEMMLMLDYLKKQDTSGYDIPWLDEVYKDAASVAKRLHMMRVAYKGAEHSYRSSIALTKRENETLHYLAQGLTQQEMAKLMGISANAVKKHISKIYFKLGAVNRADAIHIATINGLVDVLSN